MECLYLFATECIRVYDIETLPDIPIAQVKKELPPEEELAVIRDQLKLQKRTIIGGKIRVSAAVFRTTLLYLMSNTKEFNMDEYEQTIAKAQAYFRRFRDRNLMLSLKKKQAFRSRVTSEIVKTEEDYVRYLKECVSKYKPIIDKYSKLEAIPADSVEVLFNNIDDIIGFNEKFLSKLKKVTENLRPNSCWVQVFELMNDASTAYTPYLTKYNRTLERIEEVLCVDVVADALNKEKGNDKDMASYLIMPIQRLPRYVLLLKELRKHTWDEHPDAAMMDKMIDLVKSVTSVINEKKNKADAEYTKPVITEKYDVGKFKDVAKEEIIYEHDFKLNGSSVTVSLTPKYLVIVSKGVVKALYNIEKIQLLPCESKKDSFKIRVGDSTKEKLQGTKLVRDGGLIKMVEHIKKSQSSLVSASSVISMPPTTPTVSKQQTLERGIDVEEELFKRKRTGRLSTYNKRASALSYDELSAIMPSSAHKVGRMRAMSATPGRIDTPSEDETSSVSPASSSQYSMPKLSVTVRGESPNDGGRRRKMSLQEQTLKVSKHGGNNDLTRNMLRSKASPVVDGKRPTNSLGLEVYSFAELEKKPSNITKDDLVVC